MNRLRSIIYILSTLLLFSCGNENPESQDNKELKYEQTTEIEKEKAYGEINKKEARKIDEYFTNRFRKNLFNGTVLYAKNGTIIYNRAFGFENTVKKTKLNTCSSFQLASVSKPITALAILKLKEQGEINYEDQITNFFPNFPYPGITIKMLLTHRSGLPNYMYFADQFWINQEIPITNIDVINLMIKHKPAAYFKPDLKYNYSNTGYCILAAVVEKISQMPFEQFAESQIFRPLKMADTFIYRKGNKQLERCKVKGYNANNTEADNSYQNGVVGDKGVYSSAEDLYKLDQALYKNNFLNSKTLEEAFRPLHKEIKVKDNYGLGWRIKSENKNEKVVYHTGWWKGFKTYFIRDIKTKKTIIVLNNSNKGGFLKVNQLRELF